MTDVDVASCLHLTTDELLTSGADSRSRLTASGLTAYGTTPSCRDAIPFGSCTASSPLASVHAAAVALHETLRQAHRQGSLDHVTRRAYGELRAGILEHLGVEPASGVELVLSPSGTDAEYLAMLVALADRSRRLCNVVVGPHEVGSGTELAAAGLHFDRLVPHGPTHAAGTAVCAAVRDLVDVEAIELRNEDGAVRAPGDLDEAAEAIVERARARGHRVLLHVVAHSKTGVHAPSLAAVRAMQRRHGEDLTVVVDAAQGRFSRKGLHVELAAGSLVIFTGSKFYGGPPFAGALLLPPRPDRRSLPPVPAEFGAYFSRWEFPDGLAGFASELRSDYNLGLLLRWGAALEAFRLYYDVPGDVRLAVLRRWERTIPAACATIAEQSRAEAGGGDVATFVARSAPWLELDRVAPQHFPDGEERLLESKTTVFPFRLRRRSSAHAGAFLDNVELKRVARWMNEDIAHLAPDAPAELGRVLAARFHLGQPVFAGNARHPAVLRLALGAALVTQVGLGVVPGDGLDARLAWLDDQVRSALAKLDWITAQHDRLVDPKSGP